MIWQVEDWGQGTVVASAPLKQGFSALALLPFGTG